MKGVLAVVGLAALLTVTACGSPGAGARHSSVSATSPVSAVNTIVIKDFGYSGTLTVRPGADVTVVNQDAVAHTLTAKQAGEFDTGTINPGGRREFTAPTKPGSYRFGCTLHPEMSGVLTVVG